MPTIRPLALRLAERRNRKVTEPEPEASQPAPGLPDEEAIAQINTLVSNGKAAWVVLLSYLAFIGITLLGVEDADFFIEERQTELPLVGVSIPTLLFFWVAPTLGAALFVYFQLQLLKLWEAMADARDTVTAAPRKLSPWMVVDYALNRMDRNILKGRPLRLPILWATLLMVFLAAPIVLGGFWYRSAPYHHGWLTLVGCGLPFMAAIATALKSGLYAESKFGSWLQRWHLIADIGIGLAVLPVVVLGWLWTEGSFERDTDLPLSDAQNAWLNSHLVSADLAGVDFVGLPDSWRDYDTMREGFRQDWCAGRGIPAAACGPGSPYATLSDDQRIMLTAARMTHCTAHFEDRPEDAAQPSETLQPPNCETLFAAHDADFQTAWDLEWRSFLANLDRRDLQNVDLRNANLIGAQLQGADLLGAQLQGANLIEAQLQGANLFQAQMQGAELHGAQMSDDTNLGGATLRGAAISWADATTMAKLRPFWLGIFADGTFTLRDGTQRPDHWAEDELEHRSWNPANSPFHQAWRAWQDTLPGFPEEWKVQLPDD